MSCIQVTAWPLAVNLKDRYPSCCVSRSQLPQVHVNNSKAYLAVVPRVTKSWRYGPVCLFGGDKGKPGNSDEGSPWKSLEKAVGNFRKEPSVEELLKQQMAKKEYYKDGGNIGGTPPGGGSGGGGSGESEDDDFSGIMEEVLQVTLATFAFIFLYIYIIDGEDITRLAKDLIKYIFTGKKSIRLGRLMYEWSRFFERFREKEEVDEFWLERAIINTTTWYDSPEKYKRLLELHLASRSDDQHDDL